MILNWTFLAAPAKSVPISTNSVYWCTVTHKQSTLVTHAFVAFACARAKRFINYQFTFHFSCLNTFFGQTNAIGRYGRHICFACLCVRARARDSGGDDKRQRRRSWLTKISNDFGRFVSQTMIRIEFRSRWRAQNSWNFFLVSTTYRSEPSIILN